MFLSEHSFMPLESLIKLSATEKTSSPEALMMQSVPLPLGVD
jgi:hypothetical protein